MSYYNNEVYTQFIAKNVVVRSVSEGKTNVKDGYLRVDRGEMQVHVINNVSYLSLYPRGQTKKLLFISFRNVASFKFRRIKSSSTGLRKGMILVRLHHRAEWDRDHEYFALYLSVDDINCVQDLTFVERVESNTSL